MSNSTLGNLIGGLAPALLFGLFAVFTKASSQHLLATSPMLLVSFALLKLRTPISVLAPLYNMNTLVAVILGLWIFAEWRDVQALPLILGTAMITMGGIIVAR